MERNLFFSVIKTELSFIEWTKNKREELKRERDKKIFDLWLACYSQRDISNKITTSVGTVNEIIETFKNSDFAKIYNCFKLHIDFIATLLKTKKVK